MEKIILDVDPGHDDTLAIMLAAKNPNIDLEAITVVAGNQVLEKTVKNTLNICSHLDIDVPIAAGMDKPMLREQITAGEIHGKTGLDGADFGEITKGLVDQHGVLYIIDRLLESEEKMTLVPVGPLTNIAMALKLAPEIKTKIKEIVLMGGSFTVGNTNPSAEFNILADPEAAHVVFTSGLPIVMMGLDVTRQATATQEVMKAFKDIDNKAGRLFVSMMDFYIENQRKFLGVEAPPIHDPVTVAYLIDREIVKTRDMYIEVDLSQGPSYGRTIGDLYGVTGREPNVKVGVELDKDKFWQTIYETIKLYEA